MSEPITNLADAVAALGALPMGVDLAPLELSEQQIEALAAAGNRVVNDATHERLCMCDAWPERCVSTGNYYMGAWDVSGLEDALPAVLALWEQMRGGELLALRARAAELEAERHSTNEALDDAVTALRENTGRLVGLEEQLASANLRASRALIERDLMRESVSEPYGCTHCGAGKRVHGRRWLTGVGMHSWERPADEQVKARMLARRSANRLMRAGA